MEPTDEEIRSAIKILRNQPKMSRFGVILATPTGWQRPTFFEAFSARIEWFLSDLLSNNTK